MAPKKAADAKAAPGKGPAAGAASSQDVAAAPAAKPIIFLEFSRKSDGATVPICKLNFELRNDLVPQTVENFRQLCIGASIVGDKKQVRTLEYKNTRVLRVTDEILQMGDVTNREDGRGQDSIYGPVFDDEALGSVPHRFGTLSMANSGPNTNGSQFFIAMDKVPHLDSRHVSFGSLVGDDVAENQLRDLHAFAAHLATLPYGRLPATAGLIVSDCGLVVPTPAEGVAAN